MIMQSYHITQWLLFFFIYSFIGWVWESCYVSVRKRHWVNRGFMHGPMLPIYGSGALTVLVSTLGVRDSIPLIFLCGMLGATLLEYVTGAVMERLFRVRYWDYSNQKLNLHGYICISSSLCWGCFSVLLVRVIHRPIEDVVLGLPLIVVDVAAFVLTAVASVDLTQSFNEAMDLKRILVYLEESKKQLGTQLEEGKEKLAAQLEEGRERLGAQLEEGRERLEAQLEERKEQLEARLEERRERLARLLKRNPTAVSKRFDEVFDELKKFMDTK